MSRKRTVSDALDLTQDDTDEDDDNYSDSPSTSTRSSRARSRKKRSSTAVTSPSPSPPSTSTIVRMAAAGLPPRGKLWGGQGLIPDRKLEGGREKKKMRSSDDKEAHKKVVKKSEIKAVGDGLLSFPLDPTKRRKPQVLEFPESQILFTTLVKRKARSRKKKTDDSDEEESSASEEEEDSDAVNLKKIIGNPERVQRIIISGSTIQHPWTLNAFGTMPDPTRHRSPRKKKVKTTAEEKDEDQKPKKARKPAKPKRTYKTDGAKILILHDTPFDEESTIHGFKNVVTFKANPVANWNARFFYMMYTEAFTKRMHLRIAITTARPEYENWTSPENAIWVQDFPALYPAAPTAETNPTHTSFTSDFFNFVGGGSTLALNSANMSFVETARYFDFSASNGTRIVKSVGGSFKGEVALKLAGGLDSLAKAIKSFEPEFGGAWTVEYITPLSSPITRKFLGRLFAAAQGVPPVEFEAQETREAKRAAEKFKPDKIKICYPTADNVDKTQQEKVGRHALRFDAKDDLDFDRLPASDIRGLHDKKKKKYSIMHDFDLKSERVNHTTMMVIFHSDPSNAAKKSPEPYEAFIYLGSHSPTQSSWGSYAMKDNEMTVQLDNSELGVLERVIAPSWKKLVAKVNAIVPYDRTSLEPYKLNDFPCPTPEPRVVKKRGKKEKGEEEDEEEG
ncbi:hypothetical protein JCM5353_004759 [Sporobolomyces roseus]